MWTGHTRTQRCNPEQRSQALQFHRMERIQGCLQKVNKKTYEDVYIAYTLKNIGNEDDCCVFVQVRKPVLLHVH